MSFVAFLFLALVLCARVSLAADEWSTRANHGDVQRACIDFTLLVFTCFTMWVGAALLI